jgi:conserved oligomeric Golgi complex subunit 2
LPKPSHQTKTLKAREKGAGDNPETMNGFYFGGDSASASSADDEDNLPYPEALPRSDFLVPNFGASDYLSTLADRHQTLEDLRTDLRERSQALSKELLDLVNVNYEQFLSLGSDLRGGEEKVEDVRVGLLGLKRGFEEVRGKIKAKGQEVDGLLSEKAQVNGEISTARIMLEFDATLEELEENLMMGSVDRQARDDVWSDSEDDEDEDYRTPDIATGGASTRKLLRLVRDYCHVLRMARAVGHENNFVTTQQQRIKRVRGVLLLDLNTALKEANGSDDSSRARLVNVLGIYREMDEAAEAVKVLKGPEFRG